MKDLQKYWGMEMKQQIQVRRKILKLGFAIA